MHPPAAPTPGTPRDALRTQALLYGRLSSKRQAESGVSAEVQERLLRAYPAKHGMDVAGAYFDVVTGRRADRADYLNLLAAARRLVGEGWPVAVIVPKVARFGRGRVEWARALEEFEKLGVKIHSVANGGELPPFVLDVLAAVAVEESRETGDRVKTVARHLLRDGWAWAGRAPWGYRWRDATVEEARAKGSRIERAVEDGSRARVPRVLDVSLVLEEVACLREVFAMAARGVSVRAIVRHLATKTAAQRGGRALSHATVDAALRSPVYVARPPAEGEIEGGVAKFGRSKGASVRKRRLATQREAPEITLSRACGKWPALIEDGRWLAVQRQLGAGSRPGQPGNRPSGRFALTRYLRCPACESRMVGHTVRRRHKSGETATHRYYVCAAPPGAGARCTQVISAPIADEAARARLRELLASLPPTDLSARPGVEAGVLARWAQLRQTPDQAEVTQTVAELRGSAGSGTTAGCWQTGT
jgi:DNA invertase Pin-like site-specific DNA recombinase